jgi:hypothetical protein
LSVVSFIGYAQSQIKVYLQLIVVSFIGCSKPNKS